MIKNTMLNAVAWMLDYLYVSFWQIYGFFRGYKSIRYLTPTTPRPIPVIIIPGIYERWHFMKPIVDALYKRGYEVHMIDSLGYNTGNVEVMAEKIEEYVRQQKINKYYIVAHSKGGLIAKYLMMRSNNIVKTIAINTPFGGSKYARLFRFGALRMFNPASPILQLLGGNLLVNKRIVSIYGLFDPHIPTGSHLKGAKNIRLKVRGHFRPIGTAAVRDAVIKNIAE